VVGVGSRDCHLNGAGFLKVKRNKVIFVSPHLLQTDLFLRSGSGFSGVKAWAPVQIVFQPRWVARGRWAWVDKGLQPAAEALQPRAVADLKQWNLQVSPVWRLKRKKSFYPFMLAKSSVGKLLPVISSLHSKQIKPLGLNLCIFLEVSLQPGVKRKGGFIYRCRFRDESSMMILSVNRSLAIRRLSIYLETRQKHRMIWE